MKLTKDEITYSNVARLVKYGMTPEDYEVYKQSCGGTCMVCNEVDPDIDLCVDHCHTTEKVRGLLCRRCNLGIGFFRDSPDLLIKAAEYLEE